MGELRSFTGGKNANEKIQDAVQAVHDAIWEHLQGEPLAVVIGVLEIAKQETIMDNQG